MWQVLVSFWLSRRNFRLTAGVLLWKVSITTPIMVSNVFWDPWNQLASQIVWWSSHSRICVLLYLLSLVFCTLELTSLFTFCFNLPDSIMLKFVSVIRIFAVPSYVDFISPQQFFYSQTVERLPTIQSRKASFLTLRVVLSFSPWLYFCWNHLFPCFVSL